MKRHPLPSSGFAGQKKGLSTETSQCAHPISLVFGLQPVSLYVVNEQLNIVGLTEPRNT